MSDGLAVEENKITFIPPTLEEKVDRAIALEIEMKGLKKELDSIKAELQVEALEQMENKNLKYVQFFGDSGSLEAVHKEKFEVDNFPLLVEAVGKLVLDKVTRKECVKFEVESRFKEALIALAKGDFAKHNIEDVLTQAGLEAKAIKVAMKKLKGDYKKDKVILESLGLHGDLEEELDAIREAKNQELIDRFFDWKLIDFDKLKRSIFVEDSLSVGLNYDN